MSTRPSFACMLHDIWIKIATSYAQKGWKFPMLVTHRLPGLSPLQSSLEENNVLSSVSLHHPKRKPILSEISDGGNIQLNVAHVKRFNVNTSPITLCMIANT